MTVEVTCPCGRRMQVDESLAGKRVKCPTCGELLSVAAEHDEAEPVVVETPAARSAPPPSPSSRNLVHSTTRETVTGKSALKIGPFLFPTWFFGRATLVIGDDRAVLNSQGLFSHSYQELDARKIRSVDTVRMPELSLFLLGLFTLAAGGLGVAFLLLSLLLRPRFLLIRAGSSVLAMRIERDARVAQETAIRISGCVRSARSKS